VTDTTVVLEDCLERLKRGDLGARNELIERASRRLFALARRMLRDSPRISRWEEAEDLLQGSAVRLHLALADVVPPTVEEFLKFAAAQMRRELTDMARHYHGPQGIGANHATPAPGSLAENATQHYEVPDSGCSPMKLVIWTEFHSSIEKLPDVERRVFDLLWYHELTQSEAAKILDVSERQVRRHWQSARLNLKKLIGDSWDVN